MYPKVRVFVCVSPDVGGGFGMKSQTHTRSARWCCGQHDAPGVR